LSPERDHRGARQPDGAERGCSATVALIGHPPDGARCGRVGLDRREDKIDDRVLDLRVCVMFVDRACQSSLAPSSAPRNCSSASGTPTPTPSRTAVSVTIGRLRRKLGEPQLITTAVGSGYRV
jgi:hypothetical protein